MSVVNLKILSHPFNWLTLAVWLIALAILAHVLRVLPGNVLELGKSVTPKTDTPTA